MRRKYFGDAGYGSFEPRESGPPPLEKAVYEDVAALYERLGCKVIRFAQARASMQTPGIPDLKAYLPRRRLTWWHEVKAEDGRQSPAQVGFQALAEVCGERYVLGGLEEAIAFLREIGVVLPEKEGP